MFIGVSCAYGSISAARLGVEFTARRYRIEDTKQHEPGNKTADVRLPGDLLALLAEGNRAKAEQRIQSHPHHQKEQQARVTKCRHQRQGRHPIRLTIARTIAPRFERTMRLKDKTH